MRLAGFFRIAWSLQLLVGVALFGVSFLIEAHILAAFFGFALAAWVLAAALEVGKAAAIVFHRHLRLSREREYPLFTRAVSWGFCTGLLALSMLCSLLFLGAQLDRPQAAALRDAALAAAQARLGEDLARLDGERAARAEAARQGHAHALAEARGDHRRRIEGLERRLADEMDNVVGGVFKGPRYQELEVLLSQARAEANRHLGELARRQAEEGQRQAAALAEEHRAARVARLAQAERERRALVQADYDDDPRAHDPRVVAFLRMVKGVLGVELSPPQFVFAFSAALSLLVELGILLAFETVTVTANPVIAAEAREQAMSEALLAELRGHAERDALRHRDAMERIDKGAERVAERAQAHAEDAARQLDPHPQRDWTRAA